MMTKMLHEGCRGCEAALAQAEIEAKVTGSVGCTYTNDRRLVDGTYHAAQWSRDLNHVKNLLLTDEADLNAKGQINLLELQR